MATLHVRDIPDTTYSAIKQLADASNRSLSQQVITLLESALVQEQRRNIQQAVLNDIRLRRTRTSRAKTKAGSTLALLRDDRRR